MSVPSPILIYHACMHGHVECMQASSNSSQNVELLLQESNTHPSGGSLVVYATVDVGAVQVAMSGEDPSYIPLLPMGFVLSPSPPPPSRTSSATPEGDGSGASAATAAAVAPGCLLTISMQVLASAVPSAKLNLSSVTAVNHHLCNAVRQISAALGGPPQPEPAGTAAPPDP